MALHIWKFRYFYSLNDSMHKHVSNQTQLVSSCTCKSSQKMLSSGNFVYMYTCITCFYVFSSRSGWVYLHEVLSLVEPYKDLLNQLNIKLEVSTPASVVYTLILYVPVHACTIIGFYFCSGSKNLYLQYLQSFIYFIYFIYLFYM